MLAGLAGPEDVEENDDFSATATPSTRCESREELFGVWLMAGDPACVEDAELKGEGPSEVVASGLCDLLVVSAGTRGLSCSLPG